jgi:hypothetical protein
MGAENAPKLRAEIEQLARALRESESCYREAIEQGAAAGRRQEKEVARLRRLIRRVLTACSQGVQCPCCGKPGPRHGGGCPWPALVTEAEKP